MKDLGRCDYIRTSGIIRVSDIYRFVGDMCNPTKKGRPFLTLR